MWTVPGGVESPKTAGDYLQIRVPKDLVKQIEEWYTLSERVTSNRREQYLEQYRLYCGYIADDKKVKGRANFHFHQVMPQIETETSRYITSYFAHNPYVQVLPAGPESMNGASAMEELLQHYYEHAPTHFYETLRFTKYTLMYGCAFRLPSWRRTFGDVLKRVSVGQNGETMEGLLKDQLIYDGLHFATFSPHEVYPYPYARSVDQMPWVIVEEFVHIDDLINRAKTGAFDLNEVMKIPLNGDGQNNMAFRRVGEKVGDQMPTTDPYMVRLLHAFTRSRFMTSANSAVMIRNTPNFLWHGRIPLIMGVKTPDPERLYGFGSIKPIVSNQKMVNFTVNHMINQMVRNMDPVWWKVAKLDDRQLISRPNHIITAERGFGQDFGIVEMPEMKHDLLLFKQMLQQNREEVSGYYGPQKGYSDVKHTATSDSIFEAQGDKRINSDVMTFEEMSLVPEAKQCASLIEQFMPKEVAIRVVGPKGVDFVPRRAEDIQGEFDYRVGGITENINRAVQQRQLIELFELANNSSQIVQLPNGALVPMPVLNTYEALKQIYEPTAGKSTEKLLFAPELFGLPVDNQMFQQFGLPPIPGLDAIGGGQGPMAPRRAIAMKGSGSSVNPGQITSREVSTASQPVNSL